MVLKSALLVVFATALMTMAISLGAVVGAQTPSVNLTGTWTGTGHDTYLGQPDGITVTWVLRQDGSGVSGTVETLPLDAPTGSCSSCHRVKTGKFSGTLSGTALRLTMDFPEPSGGPTPACAVMLTGFAATIANDAFTTTYSGTDECEVPGVLNGTLIMALQTPPAITTHPVEQRIAVGQTANLSVVASGTGPLGYQWQMSIDGGVSWADLTDVAPYSGTTTATLTVTPASESALSVFPPQFRCVVTNSIGSATSNAAIFWAYGAPIVGVGAYPFGPADAIVNASQDASLTAAQNFPGPLLGWPGRAIFQWQVSNDRGASWNNIPSGAPYSISGSGSHHWFFEFLTIARVSPAFNGLQYRVVATNAAGSTTSNASTLTVLPPKRFLTDADGDGKSEIAIFRPSIGGWFIRNSAQGYSTATANFYQWGLLGDVPIAGDFDGDGKTDLAVFRPSIGGWFIRKSSEGYSIATASFYQWGQPGDVPIVVDFDADFKSELTVFRPANGEWFIRYSAQNYDIGSLSLYQWGQPGDIPIKP